MSRGLTLDYLDHPIAICRLPPETPIPAWAWTATHFVTVSRTQQELSITADAEVVPADVPSQRDYRAFRVRGTVAFGLIGLLSSIIRPLSEAGVSILSIGTHDTDYVLVKLNQVEQARQALERAGHHVVGG